MSFRFLSLIHGPGLRGSSLAFLTLAVAMAVVQTSRPASAQVVPATDDQIQRAIQKAVGRLRGTLPSMHGGESAVVAMALLKSGLPPETPELKAAIDLILRRTPTEGYVPGAHYVYEAGVSLMVLANADPVKYKRQIETIAEFLISVQRTCGGWYYLNQGDGNAGDTSITQYAVLGLWEASRAGVHVPKKVWDKAAGWHVRTQMNDGSFTYHPLENVSGAIGQPGTHTMTVAGTASLLVARMHLYPDARDVEDVKTRRRRRGKKYGLLEPAVPTAESATRDSAQADIGYRPTTRLVSIDKAVNSGRDWLAARFTIEPKGSWDLYYLYGLERLMALANLKELAGHDWYAEGAAHLCKVQDPGGAWHDGCGAEPATALGLLFMGKATAKMLNRAERRTPERKFGGGLLVGGRGLPEDLSSLESDQQGVRVRKLKGPVDELLAELEKADSRQIESAQSALVERIATEDPEALIGQTERLLKLARDKRIEVRRTVYWALGRTNDLRVVPALIAALSDADPSCLIEARNALQFISKRIDAHEPPDDASEAQRASAIVYWKKWYAGVRAYDERDDVPELPAK